MRAPAHPMKSVFYTVVQDYGWIHQALGLTGNGLFLAGSILFHPDVHAPEVVRVWLFIGGSSLMLIGALGRLAVDIREKERAASTAHQTGRATRCHPP